MANPVDFSDSVSYGGVRAAIYGTASASYIRRGKTVEITVTVQVTSGTGHYWQVHVNNNDPALSFAQETGTKTKTFTYDNADAGTYSYDILVYLQHLAGYEGHTYTKGPLTIDVPAAEDDAWVNVGGTWKRAAATWANVGGVWKQAEAIKTNTGGNWQ